MIIINPLSTKLKASQRVFLRHFYTAVQKNTTNVSGVDTKSQTERERDRRTDGLTVSADKALFYFT